MRHLAIGDIHGCFTALLTLARFVPFQPDDLLITLGDYVDRGPNVPAVLDWLIDREKQGTLIALRGNHEVMMLSVREGDEDLVSWRRCGGNDTLAAYSPFDEVRDPGRLVDIPQAHWDFLEGTRSWHETDTHFFVHANVFPDEPLEDQPDFMLFWEDFGNPRPHVSGKVMVCGHTSQRSGLPLSVGHAICIDTRIYAGGWLTCLDVASGRYWQANQQGQTRANHIDNL